MLSSIFLICFVCRVSVGEEKSSSSICRGGVCVWMSAFCHTSRHFFIQSPDCLAAQYSPAYTSKFCKTLDVNVQEKCN